MNKSKIIIGKGERSGAYYALNGYQEVSNPLDTLPIGTIGLIPTDEKGNPIGQPTSYAPVNEDATKVKLIPRS